MRTVFTSPLVTLAVSLATGLACRDAHAAPRVPGGDAALGRVALRQFGCGTCHVIPGVTFARGFTGPSLDRYARRVYVAGKWPNNPDVLIRFIVDPPAMAPRTAMPAVGVSVAEARDIAAYLYSLD
jgi:cytochrome c2